MRRRRSPRGDYFGCGELGWSVGAEETPLALFSSACGVRADAARSRRHWWSASNWSGVISLATCWRAFPRISRISCFCCEKFSVESFSTARICALASETIDRRRCTTLLESPASFQHAFRPAGTALPGALSSACTDAAPQVKVRISIKSVASLWAFRTGPPQLHFYKPEITDKVAEPKSWTVAAHASELGQSACLRDTKSGYITPMTL